MDSKKGVGQKPSIQLHFSETIWEFSLLQQRASSVTHFSAALFPHILHFPLGNLQPAKGISTYSSTYLYSKQNLFSTNYTSITARASDTLVNKTCIPLLRKLKTSTVDRHKRSNHTKIKLLTVSCNRKNKKLYRVFSSNITRQPS